jgi:putative aldouronate transport system permease protein
MSATVSSIQNKRKGQNLFERLKQQKILQFMILPSLILVIVFKCLPIAGTVIAFKDFDIFKGILKSPWASNHGLEHFIDLFKDPYFLVAFKNTIILAFLKIPFLSIPPVILAIMINELRGRAFKKINQTISYLPNFISWTVLGGIFYNLLDPTHGPINSLLLSMGIFNAPVEFLYKPEYFRSIAVITDMWKSVGWNSIIYIAVIASIDQSLYEAIDIDGGGRWAKIRHVMWPALQGTFVILFIIMVGRMTAGNDDMFDQCYIMGNYANIDVSEILDTYILKVGLENARYSFAAAAGITKAVINIMTLVLANKLSEKITEKSLF